MIKLADFCKKNSISYITGYRWFKNGDLPGAIQTESKTILVDEDYFKSSSNIPNDNQDALSLFLKKTIEFNNNNSSIEDFAAYILSNFQIKLLNSDQPKYSKNKPKSEEVQKHFKKFIPNNVEKPVPCTFIPEAEVWENITEPTVEEMASSFIKEPINNVIASTDDIKKFQDNLSNITNINLNENTIVSNNSTLSSNYWERSSNDILLGNYNFSTISEMNNSVDLKNDPTFAALYKVLNISTTESSEKPKRGRPKKVK